MFIKSNVAFAVESVSKILFCSLRCASLLGSKKCLYIYIYLYAYFGLVIVQLTLLRITSIVGEVERLNYNTSYEIN